ncbi:MAG: DUF2695 domain-containing protein [Propionicimonas sp.]
MTTYQDMFSDTQDRARVIGQILQSGPRAAGTTLVALVDRDTKSLLGVRSLPTPVPIMDPGHRINERQILRLSDELRGIATDLAPPRPWNGRGWAVPTSELVTVVCRAGPATITTAEQQFHWGWRYSNHGVAAFDGEIFVVTPAGWASLYGEWAGTLPALDAVEDGDQLTPEVQDAELFLAELSAGLLGPHRGECLPCYVYRMLQDYECNGQLRFAGYFREVRAPRATALADRLARQGAYCDCELLLNAYAPRPIFLMPDGEQDSDDVVWPVTLPPCRGVRGGSTRPCELWYGHSW